MGPSYFSLSPHVELKDVYLSPYGRNRATHSDLLSSFETSLPPDTWTFVPRVPVPVSRFGGDVDPTSVTVSRDVSGDQGSKDDPVRVDVTREHGVVGHHPSTVDVLSIRPVFHAGGRTILCR